jgi:PAS domain S-box-containing protein
VEEQFGYRPETFTRDNLRYDAVIHPDDLQRVLGELQHYRQRKIERFEQKYRIRRADGEYRWVDDFTVLVRDAKGEVTHYHGYVLDVTDRIAAEEERKGLEERFHRSQRLESLGLLAGGIAHDFNNLLVGILGNVDLALMDPALPEKSRSHLQNIRSATLRTADLTNQMLAYSGRGSFVVEMLDLTTLVNEMARLLRTSISRKIEIRHERIGDEAPVIKADPTSIRQVVMNLILNAADAIGDKSGVITVSTGMKDIDDQWLKKAYIAEHRAPGKHAVLQIQDTGSGMDEATAAKLFEPFFTTKAKGRGLGLSAVLGIVRSHHGAIRVDTEPGRGTTFTVALPPALARNHETAPVAGLDEQWRGEGLILVVDDDDSVRGIAVLMLEMQGFEVLQAADGKEAISVFREKSADIRGVLLDMTMPDMNGEEVFRAIRSIRDDIKVAVISGYGEQDTREKFGTLHLSAFIPKPFSQETLLKGVRTMLNQ